MDDAPNTGDVDAMYTTPGEWQELTWDYSGIVPDDALYNRITLIPNRTVVPEEKDRANRKTVFITGGSQGASRINRLIPLAFEKSDNKNIKIIHQTGKKDLREVEDIYRKLGMDAEVHPFIDNISDTYRKADLVISRAGAGAISELSALGKPSILIPYPYAANNHQYFNAKHMEKGGASVVIEEKHLDDIIFSEILDKILENGRLEHMTNCALKLAKPNATQDIVDKIMELSEGK